MIKSTNITAGGNTLVFTGKVKLHSVIINKPVASAVITIYDGIDTSGKKIGTITLPATLLDDAAVGGVRPYNIDCLTGLYIVVAQSPDVTITWSPY